MIESQKAKTSIRDLSARPGITILPGAFDALSARIAESVGFDAIFVTGAGIANAQLGCADVGLVTLSELTRTVEHISEATNIPSLVDADTGFGSLLSVRRTVRELERAGACALTLEDQTFPKRCGHFPDKQVISEAEMIERLRVALDSRSERDFLIVARTDARAVEGIDRAIERMQRYFEEGADIGFVEAPTSVEEISAVARKLAGRPLLINMVEGGKTPLLGAQELESLGFKFMLCANTALRAAIKGMRDALSVLKQDGSQARVQEMICSWGERQNLVDADFYLNFDERYRRDCH